MKLLLIHTIVLSLSCIELKAQNSIAITGTWKGSSICQVKNSPCHDESVVFHFSKADKSNQYNVKANKIVNGKELEMGLLIFDYDSLTHSITSIDSIRDATWKFDLNGKNMDGTLTYQKRLYRIVKLRKE